MLKKIFIILLLCSCSLYGAEKSNLMQNEIEHVVVVMLENRSFDNLLAWLYGPENPPLNFIPSNTNAEYFGLTEATLNQYTNDLKNSSGEIVFSSPPIKGVPSVAASKYINSPLYDPHEPYLHVMQQIFGGQSLMTGFLQDYATLWDEEEWEGQRQNICAVMETYTEKELPILYGLSRHYAVSDLWFSSVPTQTNPNRAFAACGTSCGQVINGLLGKSKFLADTIWNRLTKLSSQTTWTIFWQTDMIPFIFPGPFTGTNNFPNMKKIPFLESRYEKIDRFHERARNGELPHYSFIEPQLTTIDNVDPKWSDHEFFFGWQGNDYHPPGDVRTAENFLANIYTSLIANPETWNKTLLVITFDEHGGLFDHVIPPKALAPDAGTQEGFNFDMYGVRVPAIFISPKIKKGTVIRSNIPDVPFDHTSLIATIMKWRNIPIKKWKMGKRTKAAPTFDCVITRSQARKDSSLGFQAKANSNEVVRMGSQVYLKDKNGNYLTQSAFLDKLARVGPESERVALTFTGGGGSLTHGSFALIQPAGTSDFLSNSLIDSECFYEANNHTPGQWWTLKSAEHPFLGSEIRFGEKVYLENHVYDDIFQYVPARLAPRDFNLLKTQPIIEEGSEELYWIIEKVESSSFQLNPTP